MLSSHMALPCQGHLQQVYNIFAYLKKHHNAEMVFDPTCPDVDLDEFPKQDWSASEFNKELMDTPPDNAPPPQGTGFMMTAYVDADHASDSLT